MASKIVQPDRRRERGSIMIMTAIFAVLLLLMVGMCLDISRLYLVRAELQNAADAAALTAARELNGGSGGIDDAIARITGGNSVANTQGLRAKTAVSIATISFAANLNGAYTLAYDSSNPAVNANAAKAIASTIRFVRVTTQPTSTNILFASSVLGASQSQSREAVAGRSVGLSGTCDFFPAAVALNDADNNPGNGYQLPAEGTLMTLSFNQGTGNEAVINDREYIILEVPDINGNGTGETAVLAAGVPNFCANLGDAIHMTPSSNQNNGPRNSGDGMNTRFNVYANGYGNALQPGTYPYDAPGSFPPDMNIQENISAYDYEQRTVGQVTAPNPNGPGKKDRRMIVAPVILPNGPPPLQASYPAYTSNIQGWGVFFLRAKVPTPNGNCSNTPGCGSIPVEYVRQANVAATGAVSCTSGLTTPVLYR